MRINVIANKKIWSKTVIKLKKFDQNKIYEKETMGGVWSRSGVGVEKKILTFFFTLISNWCAYLIFFFADSVLRGKKIYFWVV